jgi:electron transport complex protein RnfG
MNEMIKMVVVLTVLSSFSGGLLAALNVSTKERIANQELEFVKGPAIRSILKGASNDPISDRFTLKKGETEMSFFVGAFDGEPQALVFETYGKGYGGDVGLMVGLDLNKDTLKGVGVTTHAETPGMGAKAKDDPSFVAQFKDLALDKPFKVTNDGGQISAISGATMTSRAVCSATNDAVSIYRELKAQLEEKIKAFKK